MDYGWDYTWNLLLLCGVGAALLYPFYWIMCVWGADKGSFAQPPDYDDEA